MKPAYEKFLALTRQEKAESEHREDLTRRQAHCRIRPKAPWKSVGSGSPFNAALSQAML